MLQISFVFFVDGQLVSYERDKWNFHWFHALLGSTYSSSSVIKVLKFSSVFSFFVLRVNWLLTNNKSEGNLISIWFMPKSISEEGCWRKLHIDFFLYVKVIRFSRSRVFGKFVRLITRYHLFRYIYWGSKSQSASRNSLNKNRNAITQFFIKYHFYCLIFISTKLFYSGSPSTRANTW